MKYALKIGTKTFTVDVGELNAGHMRVAVNDKSFDVVVEEGATAAPQARPPAAVQMTAAAAPPAASPAAVRPAAAVAENGTVIAPIPGLVLEIRVDVGDAVELGQCVAIMEAMKMENDLTAPLSGIVQEITVQKGAEVHTGQVIMRIG